MKGASERGDVPCPSCGEVLTFSGDKFRRYGDFEIGCPNCKTVVSVRNALSKLARIKRGSDGSVQ
jgi:predicted RNA-binding Zn-ribbon protein involved in translation (DUF1610 family)